MPSTYLSLHYHIVFSTKHREPVIGSSWCERLHEYLGGTVNKLGGQIESVGGVADHVHMLAGLKATHCLSDIMREVKKASSMWVHGEMGSRTFAWQEGYAAFTVSPTACDDVRRYIAGQEEHHRSRSFREELVDLLRLAGIDYDPRYLD